jgi:N-methylhydantoinase B
MSKSTEIDEIQLQILWNRLLSTVEEQAQALMRTAFSTAVREAGDLSAGVFDLKGRMLAQAVTGTPGHVNAMAASVTFFLEKFPPQSMKEGDAYTTNDPWQGTGHLHDFTVVSPVFLDGRIVALFASTSHVVDVGGLGFGPDGRQVYEEGINIPIMPLISSGEINHLLIEIIHANVREPVQVEGDLYSLAACNETGSRRLLDTMKEFGLQDLETVADAIISRSQNSMLDQIRELPFGRYENSMRIDGYDNPIDLVAELTISESGIDVDFTGTSPVCGRGINVPLTYTQAYASFGVRCVVGSQVPNNSGSLAPVRVMAPEGSILNALPPRAVAARHVIGQMLPDVVMGCLHQAVPDRVPAEGSSSLWNPVLLGGHGLAGEGENNTSTPFTINVFHTGGTGARPGKDGLSATAFPSGVRNTPVEINETIAPIIVWEKEYRTDSGGPGAFRGGAGQIMSIGHREGASWAVSAMFDRCHFPARGRDSGAAGSLGSLTLKSGSKLNNKGRQTIPAGDIMVMQMPGGGGLGDPNARSPELVAHDVKNGMVSSDCARKDYLVVVSDAGELDFPATTQLRHTIL